MSAIADGVMSLPQSVLDGYATFRSGRPSAEQSRYRDLAERGQSPEIMVIGCCDLGVSPEVIFDARPGELFVVRNVANLVPSYRPDGEYHGVSAALEFAVGALRVKHIVVLGHAHCGGVRAFAEDGAALAGRFHRKSDVADRAGGEGGRRRGDTAQSEYLMPSGAGVDRQHLDNLLTFPRLRALSSGDRSCCTGPISGWRPASCRCSIRSRDASCRRSERCGPERRQVAGRMACRGGRVPRRLGGGVRAGPLAARRPGSDRVALYRRAGGAGGTGRGRGRHPHRAAGAHGARRSGGREGGATAARRAQSSVFSVPSRAAVAALDYGEACRIAFATSQPPRKVSKQLFMLAPKIREVDACLRGDAAAAARVFEVHPELAFWRLNGEHALPEPKR